MWLEKFSPDSLAAMIEGDRLSAQRNNGHGNAIAQVYNHIIMPLASEADKRTQVIWGINAFRKYFKREPEGMHLSECAVDTETLEVLAEYGIKFTILSPSQAWRFRPLSTAESAGEDNWHYSPIDPTCPYLVRLPSGRSIAIFFYDGKVSQQVAFGNALDQGERLRDMLLAGFKQDSDDRQLMHIAVDGETFGHHHRYGEMCLAWLFNDMINRSDVEVTNYGKFLADNPPANEVQIHENSSWSCSHGIERWRNDCGCKTGAGGGKWHQKWRQPLRRGLDVLASRLDQIFEDYSRDLFSDCWSARNDFIDVILGLQDQTEFLRGHICQPEIDLYSLEKARLLLEMQHYRLLFFTSCAWFFDDISGLEPLQNLLYAARAIDYADRITGDGYGLEGVLLAYLAEAPSNLAEYESGRDVWLHLVKPLSVQRSLEAFLSEGLDLEGAVEHMVRVLKSTSLKSAPTFDRWVLQTELLKAYCHRTGSGEVAPAVHQKFVEAAEVLGLSSELLGWCRAVKMPL
ncbi:DUF3536 domain-containing protein [bacterium]|nr:DUF3536 domain-containing protein [bacterium]